MTASTGGSVELQILYCAVALGVIQVVLATLFSVAGRGMKWGVGSRDEGWPAIGNIGARTDRAWKNFLETFPLFAAAVLVAHAMDKSTAVSVLGAQLYIWGRLLYVPLYMFGVPWLRTLAWAVAFAGILMVMAAVWPGM